MADEHVPLYSSAYGGFGAREQVRQLTYGDDVGQSGWATAEELERFAEWLELGPEARLLDVGCGSGGPALRLAARYYGRCGISGSPQAWRCSLLR